jgi:hypothetical protein
VYLRHIQISKHLNVYHQHIITKISWEEWDINSRQVQLNQVPVPVADRVILNKCKRLCNSKCSSHRSSKYKQVKIEAHINIAIPVLKYLLAGKLLIKQQLQNPRG